MSATDPVKDAQELYQEGLDASRDQRRQVEADLLFSDPSNPDQWEADVRTQRENDPGGKRPCLVLDQCSQYTSQVTGQIEKQPPSIHAIPVTGGADKKAAEQIDGRFRHIEYASRATQHYTRALTSAARAGVGYLVIRPDYVDRALGWQEPRISSEPDPLKVVFDPWSVDTDGCDADHGFILTSFSMKTWKKKYPKRDAVSFGETETRKTDERDSIITAEQWLKEEVTTPTIVYLDENGEEATTDVSPEEFNLQIEQSGAPLQYLRTYKSKATQIKWRRMSGADVLEETIYPADYIGIVPVYGYVSFVDGRMRYCGIPRRARGPQQAYNYHASEMLMPGAQLIASKRAMKGVEPIWDRAHVERRAFLPYNDKDESEVPIQQPTLIKLASGLVDHAAGCERAKMDIQAAVGMYQANLGAPSNETSGVAIDARKEQGESSTAHFPSHMAASLGQVGQIVMQMDARLSDTRRKQPILGVDGSAGSVTVDPEQKTAFARSEEGVSINPNVGKYGIRVVVGASYSTQRTQTNAAFAEIMRGNKEMAPTVAPFWAQTLDFPGADKFAQALAAMAPEPVKAILQPEDGDNAEDPALLKQRVSELTAALQEAVHHAQEAQQDADEAVASEAATKRDKDIAEYEAETSRLKVTGANDEQIKDIVAELVNEMLSGPAPLPGDGEPAPGSGRQMDQPAAPQPEQQPMGQQPAAEPQGDDALMGEELAPAEPQEPAGPSPIEQLMQGQQQLTEAVLEMAKAISKPRTRVPVRDQKGAITHVIDQLAE